MRAELYKRRGDDKCLVLRKCREAPKDHKEGKLVVNWEGPCIITKVLENGVYRLDQLTSKAIPRTWNVTL